MTQLPRESIVGRWANVAARHRRPHPGQFVRVVGRGIHGVVVQNCPVMVRDGRGIEHEVSLFQVRSDS